MRLMDLPGLLCYPAHETCGFVLSKGCCTYKRCFREKCAPLKKLTSVEEKKQNKNNNMDR